MRRLLVTGGTGHLGGELVRRAASLGWDVTATYLTSQPLRGSAGGVHWARLDVTDRAAVDDLLDELDPDAVLHTAYRRDGPGAEQVIVGGAAAVAGAAWRVGARLVHMSTDAVFDGKTAGRYNEDDPPSPVSRYGRAKRDSERAVRAADRHALVVRTSLLYGGEVPGPHEEAALEAAQGERDASFFTDEVRCPTCATDLADALLELAETDLDGVLHVAGEDAVSRYEFARLVVASAGLPTDRLRPARSVDSGLLRPLNCALDSSRAARLVTAPPRGIREVLGERPATRREPAPIR
ncbi:MAG TPA: SDR family oxidoreductase [Mycobacteriales bacterium]|nr:SDR family oxidoreductase [Mycobacteriales bacterium]